jgi:HEAT repeats
MSSRETLSSRANVATIVALGLALLILAASPAASAFPSPLRRENIPRMTAESTLVCKGEVIDAPPVIFSINVRASQLTATALVRTDQCFKGQPPNGGIVPVLFDNILPAGAWSGGTPPVVPQNGDYRLYFLKPEGEEYALVDGWFGQLPISRNLASSPPQDANTMHGLEADLKAGLSDHDPDLVLGSIRMLGEMRHLQSTAELDALVDSPDILVRTTVWEATLRLHEYSVLPAVEQWLIAQPPPPFSITLPRDALIAMEDRLVRQISMIRDPATVPILVRLLRLPRSWERQEILSAIFEIKSPESAPYVLDMLDDSDTDVSYLAVQTLIGLAGGVELARGGPIDWVPSYEQFRDNRSYYANLCREWWRSNHPQQ